MKITFLGASKIVTGSCYLLKFGNMKILVDCGLYQGESYCEDLNFKPFEYDPKEISAILVTHAHIDHIGRIPQLYRNGFVGKIYSTPPTKDFAEILLLDSEHILRKEAEEKGKEPLYGVNDVLDVMNLWETVPYHERIKINTHSCGTAPGCEVEFYDAGHVLGSSSIVIRADGKQVVFSGDLGNIDTPFLKPTEFFETADYAVLESTYGNRRHSDLKKRKDLFEDIIEETARANGVLLIPAFALERTQEMIFELNELVEHKRIPNVRVFIDSPLAIKLISVYQKYSHNPLYFNEGYIGRVNNGDSIFNFPRLKMTLTSEESKEISRVPSPKIIVAGSGMSQGGRILRHEREYLPHSENSILFVGFQAKNSLGRLILDGAPVVKIEGEDIKVRARIRSISGYSAHADQIQLMRWVSPMRFTLKKIFLTHGEEEEALPLAQRIKDEFAVNAGAPSLGEEVVL